MDLSKINEQNKLAVTQKSVIIEGTEFLFDIDKIALIEKSNPENKIYFNKMRDEGTYYAFEYSAITRNHHFKPSPDPFSDDAISINEDHTITVKIPRIGIIDPDGMSLKYGCSIQDIENKSDFEIMVNQDLFNKRIGGQPATIDLVSKIYEIDLKNNALHPEDKVGEVIYLDKYHNDLYYEDKMSYHLFYNISENRVADVMHDGSRNRTEDRIILEIPELHSLDLIGSNIALGRNPKQDLIYSELKTHYIAQAVPWDFYNIKPPDKQLPLQEVVSNDNFDLRVNKGVLPTIEIADHLFYVDMRMDKLRPKDDFLSNGISFSDIDDYFSEERNAYLIPYDPKKHEFRELDYENLLSIPKDLIAVEFPFQQTLDPIGWNRQNGWDILDDVKPKDIIPHFKAKIIPWEQTYILDIIKDNKKLIQQKKKDEKPKPLSVKKSKGRKM